MSAPAAGWERRVEVVLGVAASLILLAMMLLTFVDVVARYVVNRPVRGAFEARRHGSEADGRSSSRVRGEFVIL